MTEHTPAPDPDAPEPDEPEGYDEDTDRGGGDVAEPPHPVNWNLLSAHDLEQEWLALDEWVNWLRHTYGLPASVVPPFWHRHTELLWELSALHLHWLAAYDPEQNASAPLGWHRDFADTRERLREWVATSGTRLDRDRPTRQTAWPGEDPAETVEETIIADRAEDFVQFVLDQVAEREQAEEEFFRTLDQRTGEVS
ncbi:hypothetical protein PFZ49_02245 [Microbacterium lacticum]|uniref:hypothetical protein n=1 Tax=Microbacterium lacticum TaxID=33885 RepID=UPI003A851D3F